MRIRIRLAASALACLSSFAAVSAASSQAVHLDLAVDQSFSSDDEMDSPTGFRMGLAAGKLWRGLGLQLTWRQLWEHTGEIAGFCGAFTCTDGPFDVTVSLTALGLGVTAEVTPSSSMEILLALNTSAYFQADKLEHLETGERIQRDSDGPDLGVGASADLRFPAVVFSFRPFLFLRYDHILGGDCAQDVACVGDRDAVDIGAGLAWRFE